MERMKSLKMNAWRTQECWRFDADYLLKLGRAWPKLPLLLHDTVSFEDNLKWNQGKFKVLDHGFMLNFVSIIMYNICYACDTLKFPISCLFWSERKLCFSSLEPQVIDFQTQQYKVLPVIATAYAYWFCGQALMQTFYKFQDDMKSNKFDLMLPVRLFSLFWNRPMSWNFCSIRTAQLQKNLNNSGLIEN